MIFCFSSLFFVRNVIIKKLKMMFPPNFLTISQQSCWRWLVTYFYLMLSIIFGIPFQKKKEQQLGYSIKIYTCLVFLHPHNFTGQNHMDNPFKKYTWLESIPFSLEFECPFSFFFVLFLLVLISASIWICPDFLCMVFVLSKSFIILYFYPESTILPFTPINYKKIYNPYLHW